MASRYNLVNVQNPSMMKNLSVKWFWCKVLVRNRVAIWHLIRSTMPNSGFFVKLSKINYLAIFKCKKIIISFRPVLKILAKPIIFNENLKNVTVVSRNFFIFEDLAFLRKLIGRIWSLFIF